MLKQTALAVLVATTALSGGCASYMEARATAEERSKAQRADPAWQARQAKNSGVGVSNSWLAGQTDKYLEQMIAVTPLDTIATPGTADGVHSCDTYNDRLADIKANAARAEQYGSYFLPDTVVQYMRDLKQICDEHRVALGTV